MKYTLSILILFSFLIGQGQRLFWVNSDKEVPKIFKKRVCSEWLNVCSYEVPDEAYVPFEFILQPVNSFKRKVWQNPTSKDLGFALEQIEGQLLIEKGYTGNGVKVGIIDGGFLKAPEDPSLEAFFEMELVASYKDYIDPDAESFSGSNALDDDHGTRVWQMIGGKNKINGIQYGLATDATYYLARTDHGSFEKRIEEDYLIAALEWMEKEGVRLVNISLGYAEDYSDPRENYTPEDMDGQTSMMAKAVDHAYYEKNMLVVVAAGNEGLTKDWQVLSTPGDAKGALTVGATKLKVWDKMDYSSIGPGFMNYLKPNVSVYSTSGTSFSAPIITGLAAVLMQMLPDYSAKEIKTLLERSGNFYPYGNNYVGYGVPKISRILEMIDSSGGVKTTLLMTKKNTLKLRSDFEDKVVVLYHKKDSIHVDHRLFLRPEHNLIKIKRPEGISFTSVLLGEEVTEISWRSKNN